MKIIHLIFLSTLLPCLPVGGQGTTLWNESVNGWLSRNGDFPTSLGTAGIGTNRIISSVEFEPVDGGPGGVIFSDFFTISISPTTSVTDLRLTSLQPIAIWIGDTAFSNQLALVVNPTSGALLPQVQLLTLPAGNYGFYISNHQFGSSPSVADYRLDFVVVPEPSSLCFLFGGLSCLGLRFWQTRTRRIKPP